MNKPNFNNLTEIIFNVVMLNSANHEMIDLSVKLLPINKTESDNMVQTMVENECKRLSILN